MLTITSSKFNNSDEFQADFLIPRDEYELIEKKVIDKYVSEVEVDGFRKGKAPRDKALLKADPMQIQELVFNQAINDNYSNSTELANDIINKDSERAILNISLVQTPDSIKLDEKGFGYSFTYSLAPNIDLSFIPKLSVPKIHVENLPGFISLEEFTKNQEQFYINAFGEYVESDKPATSNSRIICDLIETNLTTNDSNTTNDNTIQLGMRYYPVDFESNIVGLKSGENKTWEFTTKDKEGKKLDLKIEITVKSVLENKTLKITELLESNDNFKSTFPDSDAFNTAITEDYNKDKSANETKFQTRAILEAVVKNSPKIEIDEELVSKEVTRITTQLESNESDPAEAFNSLGFLFASRATKSTLKKEVENYIRGEFTLEKLFFAIYLTKVEEKITSEEIDSNYKVISENPSQYQFPQGSTGEELKNQIFDRILRNKSQNWIVQNVTIK
jgi:trigger factor